MITIRVEGAKEVYGAMARLNQNLTGGPMQSQVGRDLKEALDYAKEIAPRGATHQYVRGLGMEMKVAGGMEVRGELTASAPHSEYVEFGTKPHWPPPGPILAWVLAKGMAHGSDAKRVAFLVSRAIARRGTQAQRILQRTMEAKGERIGRNLQRTVQRIIVDSQKGGKWLVEPDFTGRQRWSPWSESLRGARRFTKTWTL